MTSWQLVRIIGGFFILLSLALGVAGSPIYHNANWLWFTAFVGVNLLQSGFTGFCPPEKLLAKMGFKRSGNSCGN
mgnify:CR=1 FL=1